MALNISLYRARIVFAAGVACLVLGTAMAVWFAWRPRAPLLPPASSAVSVLRPLPSVLLAVHDLARLESASFHMERVIDLSDKQSLLFGLVRSEDAILLVAVADISAGVDLQQLQANDLAADWAQKRVTITLPAPQVFHAELDNSKTYVHKRHTGALAFRKENLETRARQEAERSLIEAALQAGLLNRASDNARRAVEGLVRGLGYEQVEVKVRPPVRPAAPPAAVEDHVK